MTHALQGAMGAGLTHYLGYEEHDSFAGIAATRAIELLYLSKQDQSLAIAMCSVEGMYQR